MFRSYMPSSPDFSSNQILEFVFILFFVLINISGSLSLGLPAITLLCNISRLFNFCMWISQAAPFWNDSPSVSVV